MLGHYTVSKRPKKSLLYLRVIHTPGREQIVRLLLGKGAGADVKALHATLDSGQEQMVI
jgi:hypothetical protein